MNTTASFKQGRFIRWYCNIWLGGMVYYLHHGDSSPRGPSYLVRPICPLSRLLSLTPPPDAVAVHTHTHTTLRTTLSNRHPHTAVTFAHAGIRPPRLSPPHPPLPHLSPPHPPVIPDTGDPSEAAGRGGDGPAAHGLWCAAGPNSPSRSLPVTAPHLSRPRRRATTSKNRGGTPLSCKSLPLLPVSCRCLR
jgi:hypothetical protein